MATFNWLQSANPGNSMIGTLVSGNNYNGIKWSWKSQSEVSKSDGRNHVYFAWQFEWDELIKQGIEGFDGTIAVDYNAHPSYNYSIPTVPGFPKTFNVELTRSGQWIEMCLGSEDVVGKLFTNSNQFKCTFNMTPFKSYDEDYIIKENFAPSDKTDAILVVEGRKLHVNKQFLSFHSEFFNTLFNSEFKEKSMDEIPIGDVKYDDFARLLSVVYPYPILPTVSTSASLLKLADRFMMPLVTRLVEPFLIRNETLRISEKIWMADDYLLKELLESCLNSLKSAAEVKKITETSHFEKLSDATKLKLFYKMLSFS